ncbi:MAG: nucleotide exchange factor GrpE [Candidatus Sulfobium sp.]
MKKPNMKDVESGKNKEVEEAAEEASSSEEAPEEKGPASDEKGQDLNDKYLRLYAEFENYKKRVSREKEDLLQYGNEALLYELLPAIDHLELALKHASRDAGGGIVQGVEITLKELQRTLEKFGLRRIESTGRSFDPAVHHAMAQVEREDMNEKMVAEEFRAGYLYRDKVLRPSLVAVSVKPATSESRKDEAEIETDEKIEEEKYDG